MEILTPHDDVQHKDDECADAASDLISHYITLDLCLDGSRFGHHGKEESENGLEHDVWRFRGDLTDFRCSVDVVVDVREKDCESLWKQDCAGNGAA